MKLLVISDTHGEMPIDMKQIEFDVLVHAGDIGNAAFFGAIEAAAGTKNIYAVYGNTDLMMSGWLPETVSAEVGGTRLFVVHNLTAPHRILPANAGAMKDNRSEIVVFGHTHIPDIEERGGTLFINPGSLGKSGLTGHRSFAVAEIDDAGNVSAKIFDADSKEVLVAKNYNKINGLFKEI